MISLATRLGQVNRLRRRRFRPSRGSRGPRPIGTNLPGPRGPATPLPPGGQPPPGSAPPPLQNLPAPPQPENELARQNARLKFQLTEAENRRRAYQAALNYGDIGEIGRLSGLGYGPELTEAPLSTLGTLARQEPVARRQLGEAANAANTYFSGLHLKDQSRLAEEFGLQRSAATQEYMEAAAELAQLMAQAQYERDEAISAADLADIRAAEAQTPEPQEEEPVTPPSSGGGGGAGSGGGKGKGKKKPKKKGKGKKHKGKRQRIKLTSTGGSRG